MPVFLAMFHLPALAAAANDDNSNENDNPATTVIVSEQ